MKNFILFLTCAIVSLQVNCSFKVKDGQVILESLESLEGYDLCQASDRSGNWCHDALKRYVESHPKDSWKAAILTRKSMNSWGAIPFFWKARSLKVFNCKNKDLLIAIKASYSLHDSQKEIIKKAHDLAFKNCSQFIPAELGGVMKSKNSFAFKAYCGGFLERKLIKGVLRKKCLKIQ
jgi:hypothetical protein